MSENYTEMPENELLERAQNGDHAAHFEQGRRSALTQQKAEKSAKGKASLKAMRSRWGIGGMVLWGIFQLISLTFGPACIAGILYFAYSTAVNVYFDRYYNSWLERGLLYIGTFFFIGLTLRLATVCTQYLLARRPVSTLVIIAMVVWYLYDNVSIDNFMP